MDRIFQTPRPKHLHRQLIAVAALDSQEVALPVEPSHGNFYEAGMTKSWAAEGWT